MNCSELERRIYSDKILNQAMSDDSGSWWWWVNIIGTLCFGTIGLIGNIICCLLVYRSTLSEHSFVEYLRSLSIFDILSLLFELIQSLNDLFKYKYQINLLNFSSRFICKFYEYLKHVVILLSCWTIVGLTFDRLILVCNPLSKKYPNISRRICNRPCAKKILWIFIFISLIINIPHLLYQEWVCRYSGYQHSAAFSSFTHLNQTLTKSFQVCQCRISTNLDKRHLIFFVQWNIYVYHLFSYTLIPAIILITSNIAILKVLHKPRQVIGQRNIHLKWQLTRTLTMVSIIFLLLYFPHALVENISIKLIPKYRYQCDISSLILIRILKRLCELLNIIALSINCFLYILCVSHYRSSAIQILGLDRFQFFVPYLTSESRSSRQSIILFTNSNQKRSTATDSASIKLFNQIHHDDDQQRIISKQISL